MRYVYRIAVDSGGTFTDFIAASEAGDVVEVKVPSNRERPELAIQAGLEELRRLLKCAGIDDLLRQTHIIIQGTTVPINTLLQGTGAKTGLLCTKGFRDTLEIRLGQKDERYRFNYTPTAPLVPARLRCSVAERVDKRGRIVRKLVEDDVERAVEMFDAEEVEAVAICFLWSFLNPAHEHRAAELIKLRMPHVFVSASVEVLPIIREYNRLSTTVLNAYIGPRLNRYVARTEELLRALGFSGRIRYVQSNGGLAESSEVRRKPVFLLVSGPAGGPAAGLHFGRLGGRNFITIDVGGTSFDACLIEDNLPGMRGVTEIGGYRIAAPLIDVQSIGAGGGSIATVEEGLLRVGPESSEADPGPACYGKGGRDATLSDANVVVGALNPSSLLGGRFPIREDLARRAVATNVAAPLNLAIEAAAAGIVEVASRNMADAIRQISVQRGRDPREYSMIVGGGAGGLHAIRLAQELGITRVVVPRVAAAFCAFGAAVADLRHDYSRSYVARLETISIGELAHCFADFEAQARRALDEEGVGVEAVRMRRLLDVRYKDQIFECTIDVTDLGFEGDEEITRAELQQRFHQKHEELYHFNQPGYPCQAISMKLVAIGSSPRLRSRANAGNDPAVRGIRSDGILGVEAVADRTERIPAGASGRRVRRVWFEREGSVETEIRDGRSIGEGEEIRGPVVIEEPNTTIVVPKGWQAVLAGGENAYVIEPSRQG